MTRTNIHFSKKQLEKLKQVKERVDLPMAEIVRRAVDEFLLRKYKV